MKCPKKNVNGDFDTWHHLHNFLKCPKIDQFQFGSCSVLKYQVDHVLFFWNAPLSYVRNFWKAWFFPFSESDRKNGAFQKLTCNQFLNEKGTENEIIRFWGISKNYAIDITWQNYLSHAFWGISSPVIGSCIPFEDCVELSFLKVSINFRLRCSRMIKCVNISRNIEMKFFILQRQSFPWLWPTQQVNGKWKPE